MKFGHLAWAIAVCGLTIALAAAASTSAKSSRATDRAIERIMDQPQYSQANWGLLETDPRSGSALRSLRARKTFVPGSVAKLFVVSAAWNTLGPDHRFMTPLYALGKRQGPVLKGNLVLEAAGDLTMGGRMKPNGQVAYADVDHTYANSVPGATLTRGDPLAGLNEIAAQVRAAGISEVAGDVIVDDRLWQPDPNLTAEDPGTDPMIVNDNVVDVRLRPTEPGEPAKLFWQPKTAAIQVESQVITGPRSDDANAYHYDWSLSEKGPGKVVAGGGKIAANAKPQLLTFAIDDPASFARTALIEALARAGVEVAAPALGSNPDGSLPARDSYAAHERIAAYRSPPFRQYGRLILKVSHNLGAQVSLCLLAVHVGSDDCERGFGVERRFLKRAGVPLRQIALGDGRGGDPYDRATPRAMVALLSWWLRRPDFGTFKRALPILGVDGDLALSGKNSPARGKVFAKTGAGAGFDALNDRLVLSGKAMAGYLASRRGRPRPFALFMNNGFFPADPAEIFTASADLARIAALMQQDQSRRGR